MKGVREGLEARYLPSSPWWGAIGLGGADLGFEWDDLVLVLVPASAVASEPGVLSAASSDSVVSSAANVVFESSEISASDFSSWYCCSIRMAEGSTETKSPGARRVFAFECYSPIIKTVRPSIDNKSIPSSH